MFKKVLFCISTLFISHIALSKTSVSVQINNADPDRTILYLSVFNNEEGYKKRVAYISTSAIAGRSIEVIELELSPGNYLFSVFQDLNKNKKCDSNLIGIPKEPVGISKYDGKGAPGNFQKHKVYIGSESVRVSIDLHRL
ncbi:MAG: hypothetical protein BGO30_05775 [Bacteroidetes bacterium 41-46]|jgi:uncharacterized protein (DUF2141 family)|nr:MAG: hypothetical protein BGO30_05775 [Bacteroidetes bacterium 41-46]